MAAGGWNGTVSNRSTSATVSGSRALSRRHRITAIVVAVSMGFTVAHTVVAAPDAGTRTADISPELVVVLGKARPDEMIAVVVHLRERASLTDAARIRDRGDRLRAVVSALRNTALASQTGVRVLLQQAQRIGTVSTITPLWVLNAIAVTATPDVINRLAERNDVESISTDIVDIVATGTPTAPAEPNVSQINAPVIWALGHDGEGVVVASLDSGVDITHPDLAGSYRGETGSWFDPFGQHPSSPMDMSGHGTSTMGIMVGGGAGGTTIGVAPGATWMAARVFDDNGNSSATAIHLALQWTLDPDGDPNTADAPAVVNNSWAFGSPGCNLEFQADLQSMRGAGIVPVFSAGNSGPSGSTGVSPANYPEALSVGAVNQNDKIWSSSSRGPSACGESSTTYPDLVAPGVNIWSTQRNGLYGYSSGTSNAAPAVSGALALLFSTQISASDLAENALLSTAVDLGTSGPDNSYGRGRIDVAAAYAALDSGTSTTTTTTTTEPPTTTTESTTTTTEPTTTTLPPTTTTTLPPTTTTVPPTTTTTTTTLPPTTTTTTTTVPSGPPDLVFADAFESGSMSAWSSSVTNAGRLSVTPNAALSGSFGLGAVIANRTAMYLTDASPNAQTAYHARFRYDPNGLTVANGKIHSIFTALGSAGTETAALQVRTSGGQFQLRVVARRDNGKSTSSAWTTISDAPHVVELGWAAAASGSNGSVRLWVDGTQVLSATGLANGAQRVDDARLGPQSIPAGVSGSEYFDDFVSTTSSYIGV